MCTLQTLARGSPTALSVSLIDLQCLNKIVILVLDLEWIEVVIVKQSVYNDCIGTNDICHYSIYTV